MLGNWRVRRYVKHSFLEYAAQAAGSRRNKDRISLLESNCRARVSMHYPKLRPVTLLARYVNQLGSSAFEERMVTFVGAMEMGRRERGDLK